MSSCWIPLWCCSSCLERKRNEEERSWVGIYMYIVSREFILLCSMFYFNTCSYFSFVKLFSLKLKGNEYDVESIVTEKII